MTNEEKKRLAESFRKFTDEMLEIAWGGGCADGAAIQETAIYHGLLKEVLAKEPCGERCGCAEVTDFPTMCYRKTYT